MKYTEETLNTLFLNAIDLDREEITNVNHVIGIHHNGVNYYVFIKMLSYAGNPHPRNKFRVQLPYKDFLEPYIQTPGYFLMLGFNDIYKSFVCWSPAKVQPRLNQKEVVSLFCDINVVAGTRHGEIGEGVLQNGDKYAIFHAGDFSLFLDSIGKVFDLNIQKTDMQEEGYEKDIKKHIHNGEDTFEILEYCISTYGSKYPEKDYTAWRKIVKSLASQIESSTTDIAVTLVDDTKVIDRTHCPIGSNYICNKAINRGNFLLDYEDQTPYHKWTEMYLLSWKEKYLKVLPLFAAADREYKRGRVPKEEIELVRKLAKTIEALADKYLGVKRSLLEEPQDKHFIPTNISRLNQGTMWTKNDDKQLPVLYKQGKSIAELASIFSRSEKAIYYRLETLGIISSNKNPYRKEERNEDNDTIEIYKKYFSSLKTSTRNGEKAPHKIILLLTIIDLIRQDYSFRSSNLIELSDRLEAAFVTKWRELVDSKSFEANIAMPFYHMKSEPFWHLEYKDYIEPTDLPESPALSSLRGALKGAEIDNELRKLLISSSSRKELRDILINQLPPKRHVIIITSQKPEDGSKEKNGSYISKNIGYYKTCFENIANKYTHDFKKALNEYILLLSTIEYIQKCKSIGVVSHKLPLLGQWEGIFLKMRQKYLILGRESTSFSTPFITLGEEPFWHLQFNEGVSLQPSVRALKTFVNLQEIYQGVEIDTELYDYLSNPTRAIILKQHLEELIMQVYTN